ncbi:MAG: gamma carbonic anhydrase family protein [Candidatus Altiarchaeia archaeon]
MIIPLENTVPGISEKAFIAKNASVIGNAKIGEHSSVWFGAVLRADCGAIEVGKNTNIQDNCVVHADPEGKVIIGDNVTIGHGAIVHGCTIKDNVLVGMNATVLNDALIGRDSIVGAGALVTQGKKFPERSLILGVPAKVARELTEEEVGSIRISADEYVLLANRYKAVI